MKQYNKPELQLITLLGEDILTVSGPDDGKIKIALPGVGLEVDW